jgi:hypothetical protein
MIENHKQTLPIQRLGLTGCNWRSPPTIGQATSGTIIFSILIKEDFDEKL